MLYMYIAPVEEDAIPKLPHAVTQVAFTDPTTGPFLLSPESANVCLLIFLSFIVHVRAKVSLE